jgi:hypothetical protein
MKGEQKHIVAPKTLKGLAFSPLTVSLFVSWGVAPLALTYLFDIYVFAR